MPADDVTVVVVTRNRCRSLHATLQRLTAWSAPAGVVVVDNGSSDGTTEMVSSEFPDVSLIPLRRNRGAIARNLGAAAATTELVAFADDDSWWAAGALERATREFASQPDLGLLAARILVGPEGSLDATCEEMAASPLGENDRGQRRILGFVACGAVARRRALADCGGFDELLFFLGEEASLALDLAANGWELIYEPDVVAFHHPGGLARDPAGRRRGLARNRLLTSALHRPWSSVARELRAALASSRSDGAVRAGLVEACRLAPAAWLHRHPVPPPVEASRRLLD